MAKQNQFSSHSYRKNPNVPAFDDTVPLIIFDGQCVLCSRGVQWMLARDPKGDTRFVVIQDEIPRALYRHYGLDADSFDTFIVLADGKPYLRWQGVMKAARLMPMPWRFLGQLGCIVPDFLGNPIYDFVQRNRLSWFGTQDVCFVPDDKNKVRLQI